jgi:hypothetical protein
MMLVNKNVYVTLCQVHPWIHKQQPLRLTYRATSARDVKTCLTDIRRYICMVTLGTGHIMKLIKVCMSAMALPHSRFVNNRLIMMIIYVD